MAGTSKYFDIKRDLERRILAGELEVGARIPSEKELGEQYPASRGTIRQALQELERDGLVSRRSGLGTFVARKPDQETRRPREGRILSLAEQITAAGKVPSSRLLSPPRRIMASQAGGRVLEAFGLTAETAARTPVLRIERLRCADGHPVAHQIIFLLAKQFRADFLAQDLERASMFQLYANAFRYPSWADEIVRARPATAAEVALLEMDDLPDIRRYVCQRERITYDQANTVIEVLSAVDRQDFFASYRYRILEGHRIETPEAEETASAAPRQAGGGVP